MISDETIWITGASSGLGYELAKQLAPNNHLILSARNQTPLLELANRFDNILVVPLDISIDYSPLEIEKMQKIMSDFSPHIDRVMLNAGICEYFEIEQPNWKLMAKITNTNFFGSIRCIEIAWPLLIKAAHSHIIAIGSQATLMPFTRAEAYGASKAALSYFLDSLRIDLTRYNIDVTQIAPGFIDTPIVQQNDFPMPFKMSATKAAKKIIHAVEKRPSTYLFPKALRYLLLLLNTFPKKWQLKK